MATRKKHPANVRQLWPRILFGAALIAAVLGWFYSTPVAREADVAVAYGARIACSCRFVGGRELGDCDKDFEPGMGMVFLSQDTEAKSVTATIPLVSSDTAFWTKGSGCVLENWDG